MNIGAVFNWVVHISVMASVLVLIILFVRFLFGNRIGSKWVYTLWFLVVIRLVMPLDIQTPYSVFNVFHAGQWFQAAQKQAASKEIPGEKDIPKTYDAVSGQTWSNNQTSNNFQAASDIQKQDNISETGDVKDRDTFTSVNSGTKLQSKIDFNKIWPYGPLSAVWLIGMLVFMAWILTLNVRFYRKIKGEPFFTDTLLDGCMDECMSQMSITKRIPVILTSKVCSPSLTGVFHPKLLIPENLMRQFNEKDLKCMIMHELSHYKRKDIAVNWLIAGIQVLHWFNPVIWYAFNCMRKDCEIAADAKALTYMNPKERRQYGYTLITMSADISKTGWLPVTTGFSIEKSQIKRRISMIKLFKNNSYKLTLAGLVAVVMIGAVGLTSANSTSKTTNSNPAATPAAAKGNDGLVEGDTVSVEGENSNFSLRSVNFIDENTGWIVRGASDSDNQASQVLITEDGGMNWNITGMKNMTVDKLKFADKTNGWAIAKDAAGNSEKNQPVAMKILHTKDSGKTWDVQWESKSDLSSASEVWIHDVKTLYMLVGGQLLSTRDGGEHWSKASFGAKGFVPEHMSFSDISSGWVIGLNNDNNQLEGPVDNTQYELLVLHTTDGGASWKKQFSKTYAKGEGPIGSIGINFASASEGWFLTSNMATWVGELYRTSNAGQRWEKINEIKCVRPSPMELDFVSTEEGWIPLNVGAGPIAGGLMVTRDGGKSFNIVGDVQGEEPSLGRKIQSASEIEFTSLRQGWAIGRNCNYGDYLAETEDGGNTWTQVYPKITPTQDISFVDSQHGYGIGQLSDPGVLLYTSDGGETWNNIKSFISEYQPDKISFADSNNGWIVAGKYGSDKTVILKTSDAGKTWVPINEDFQYGAEYFRFFDKSNGIIVMTEMGKHVLYKTLDGGKTWQKLNQEQLKSGDGLNQYAFISGSRGWIVYDPGNYKSQYNVEISAFDGLNWQEYNQVEQGAWPYAVHFLSENKGWMLVEERPFKQDSHMKLMTTKDGGKTWAAYPFPDGFNGNTLVMLQNQLPMQFTDDLHGWILSAHGMLRTMNGGKTWTWQ